MSVLDVGLAVVQLHWHQGHYIACVQVGDNHRCTFCGHRLTVDGVQPVETRKLPPWKWITEIMDRRRAMAQFAWREETWTTTTS